MNLRPFRQFRTNIVAGILIMTPLVTTLYVIFMIFGWVDSILPKFLHALLPVFPETWMFGTGFVVILLLSYFIGLAAKNYFGKFIIDTGNAIISSIPLLNKVYLGIQQIVDAVAGHKKGLFDRPVLIEYPKENCWSVGFVTSETQGEVPVRIGKDTLSIFIPTTPNPTSGFLLFIPKDAVIELDMTVETAIKTVMSAGMVNPDVIRETNHMYTLPKQLKNFNWTRIFSREKKDTMPDPRD